ncbi:MAG TPA: 6-phosphogluconolactonase [Candidatus Saccharimonadia bacterium]|nr:6-phosphogluconolactonase [Candidatus Saccharimonadia bacterium]
MQLEFIPASSPQPVAAYLAAKILAQLADGRSVLWLLSGGSGIATAVATASLLSGHDLSSLTVSLIDERYGPPGHADSNWHQLEVAGLKLPGATLHPVLTGASESDTAAAFAKFLADQFDTADHVLGLLGIGLDGHTSGILPHSPAVTAPGLVCAYDGGQYQRLTTTPRALKHLNEAVAYAAGEAKWPVLDRLETDLPIAEQPAQALKAVPHLTIFTDRPLH